MQILTFTGLSVSYQLVIRSNVALVMQIFSAIEAIMACFPRLDASQHPRLGLSPLNGGSTRCAVINVRLQSFYGSNLAKDHIYGLLQAKQHSKMLGMAMKHLKTPGETPKDDPTAFSGRIIMQRLLG